MLHFDEHLTTRLREAGKSTLFFWRFLASYGILGFPLCLMVFVVVGVGSPISWLFLCIPVALTHILTLGLQLIIRRPRPPIAVSEIQMWWRTSSFPSAHSAGSMAFAIMFANTTIYFSFGIAFAIGIVVFAFLIGLSRIMVGVHYLGDVLAGFLFGILVTGIFLSVM